MVEKTVPQNNHLQNEIEVHKRKVESFLRRTPIHDYIDSCSELTSGKTSNVMPVHEFPPDPAMFVPFQLTFSDKLLSQSMGVIVRLQNHVMKHFSLPHPTLLLGAVSTGSTVVTFHFPRVELERVTSLANLSSRLFSELNVESVTIDNQLQYQNRSLALATHEARPSVNEQHISSNLGQFPGEGAPHVHHLEDLSEVEQRLFYTRVLCTNFNFLYQHLNTPAILKKLEERGLIEHHSIKTINELSGVCAQNTLAVLCMQQVTAPPNCMEKLCEILNQDHIARKLFCAITVCWSLQCIPEDVE
jgi:hypothetical protein